MCRSQPPGRAAARLESAGGLGYCKDCCKGGTPQAAVIGPPARCRKIRLPCRDPAGWVRAGMTQVRSQSLSKLCFHKSRQSRLPGWVSYREIVEHEGTDPHIFIFFQI